MCNSEKIIKTRNMYSVLNHIIILTILFVKSQCESCINLLDNKNENTDFLLPDRIWRYNSKTNDFENLEYLKPNRSALCSIEFSNDLEGKILNVAVDELNPYSILIENNTKVTGFFGDAWMVIQDALKFKTIFTPSNDYSILKTGKFDAHLTGSLVIFPTTAYYAHSIVIGKNSYSLFALSEGTFVSKWWYAGIFDKYVWLLSTFFVIVLTLSMVSIHNIKKNLCKQIENCHEFGYPTFNLLCVLGATSGQGFQEVPRSWSLRVCALTALNMGMVLSCGFNSTLTSYLAFRAPYVGMNDLEDVWKVGTHSLCVRNRSLAYEKLTEATTTRDNPTASKDKWTKQLNRKCPDMEDEIALRHSICRPGFVYVEASDVFLKQYRYVQDKCQIVKIPGAYWSSKISFLHSRGSKYRKIIDNYLLRLRSTGILKYLEAKWSFQQDLHHGVFNNFQEVELGHVQLLIVGLIIVTILSVIICILENIWYKLHNPPGMYQSSVGNNILPGNLNNSLIWNHSPRKLKKLQNALIMKYDPAFNQ